MRFLHTLCGLVLAVCLTAGSAERLRAHAALGTPLDDLKVSAGAVQQAFEERTRSPAFGKGLNPSLVEEVKRSSSEFWAAVQSLSPSDVAEMDDEDAAGLQALVREVAQLDDDMDNPERVKLVPQAFERIAKELEESGADI